jgi:hypothetical protein
VLGTVDKGIAACVQRMKNNAQGRNTAMNAVRQVRRGMLESISPDSFSSAYPKSLVANFVDVAASDLARSLSALPSLKCSYGQNRTAADKRRGEKKNRIAANYWRKSKLTIRMKWATNQYVSYGFLPMRLEANYTDRRPVIIIDDPMGTYYELDRWMDCVRYARTWRQKAGELAALYADTPEVANRLTTKRGEYGMEYDASDDEVEVVFYEDDTRCVVFVPERDGLVLNQYDHGLGFCPVKICLRPGLELTPRGQFDDTIWIQLARSVLAALSLEAAHKAVQAPIAVPDDITELNIGADAVIQTANPQNIQRIKLDVPQTVFAFDQRLDQEQRIGAGYPDGRMGQANASVITGRGIEELMGSFDSQIKDGQDVIGDGLKDITGMAFKMDVALWPNKVQTINGTLTGESFEVTYTPKVDIGEDTECDVTYGFAAGLSPQNAIVMLLQLRGDGLIDRDTFRRQLPFDLDNDVVQRHLDVERTEDALKEGVFSALGVAGQMMAQGQVDQALNFFKVAAAIIDGRQKGQDLAGIITTTFEEQAQEAAQKAQEAAAAQAGAGGSGGAPGAPGAGGIGPESDGLPPGVAPGQAGMGAGGMPSIQQLVAGVTGGKANMNASVRKRIPTG